MTIPLIGEASMNSTEKRLRGFGLVMAGALAVIGVLGLLRDRGWWPAAAGLAGAFALSGLGLPGILKPVEWFWMKLAAVLGFVVTHVILTVFFFLVITPAGLLMRLFGKDPLRMRSSKCSTCWVSIENDGPWSRPDKPY